MIMKLTERKITVRQVRQLWIHDLKMKEINNKNYFKMSNYSGISIEKRIKSPTLA